MIKQELWHLPKNCVNWVGEIISTGGTKTALDAAGVTAIAIDDVTGFPE